MKITTEKKPNKTKKAFFYFILLSFSFYLAQCNTTEPPPESKATAELTVEDVSSTEVWLNVKLQNVTLPAELKLFRADSVTQIINLSNNDTLLYEEGLLPAKTYKYRAAISQSTNHSILSSNIVAVTTMDTTSHNFTWQTYTFGGVNGSSVLNDVAIINENDIWAVGEIHTADDFDSTGNYVGPYNAVHWDGQEWKLKRIYVDYRGQPNLAPLTGVFALPDGEIIFSSGLPYLPEGDHWKLYHLWDMGVLNNNDGSVYSIWGTSIDNLYFAGNKGTIAHYNGSVWTKIASGTTTDINDIYGFVKSENQLQIYAAVSNRFDEGERGILDINNQGQVTSLSWEPQKIVSSIWTPNAAVIYTAGGGIYNNKEPNTWTTFFMQLPSVYSYKIRGNGLNDIFVSGDYGLIGHFNGKNWKSYPELNLIDYQLFGLNVKTNLTVVVGSNARKAIIIIGKR